MQNPVLNYSLLLFKEMLAQLNQAAKWLLSKIMKKIEIY